MAKWKLTRQKFGSEEFIFSEGEKITVGRGTNNTIALSSIVVSRNHCVFNVEKDKVVITDLKSSNGIYVGLKKIQPNVPYTLDDSDVIGFGWTVGAPVANINDNEKYIFKLVKEKMSQSVTDRILFQSDTELDEIERKVAAIDATIRQEPEKVHSPIRQSKLQLKRKLDLPMIKVPMDIADIISISDSENEAPSNQQETTVKKLRLELDCQEVQKPIKCEPFKVEKDELEYEAFNVKQEYLGYDDDEAIQCDSDSDSESEHWLLRLSQSSPGKPFIKAPGTIGKKPKIKVCMKEESSYSQLDDYIDDEDYEDDLISIPLQPPEVNKQIPEETAPDEIRNKESKDEEEEEFLEDLISLGNLKSNEIKKSKAVEEIIRDEIDGGCSAEISKEIETVSAVVAENNNDKIKRAQMIEPLVQHTRKKITAAESKLSSKQRKGKKRTSSKKHDITDSQKKERKKKLKEIANKEKEECEQRARRNSSSSSKPEKAVASVKVTGSNRGAFLTADIIQGVVKPMKRKESPQKSDKEKIKETSSKGSKDASEIKESKTIPEIKRHGSIDADIENKKKKSETSKTKKDKGPKHKEKKEDSKNSKESSKSTNNIPSVSVHQYPESRMPLKSKKPLTESEVEKEDSKNNKEASKSTHNKPSLDRVPHKSLKLLTESEEGFSRKEDSKNSKEASKLTHNKPSISIHQYPDRAPLKSLKPVTESEEGYSGKEYSKNSKEASKSTNNKPSISIQQYPHRVPLKRLKPLTQSEEGYSGKPFSKVEPLPPKKTKKKVRFSDAGPMVHVFEIEDGNKLKKTSLVKMSLMDVRQTPVFSLKKVTLMKILRWNPHWLEEQKNNNEPPPILGHNSLPMTIFHSFNSHNQYVQLVGDLLLMEIWECLTQGYMRIRVQNNGLQMRIASLPPVPSQERCFELFNLSVDISLPNTELRRVPRMGEVMIIDFGPENDRTGRFFFVHNVRNLPSPPNNIHSFFNISLHACYTDKMKSLRPGELMIGTVLSYINKEVLLFEAMEYLAGSPLSEAILRPEPKHFIKWDPKTACNINTQWTKALNASQQLAVNTSVSAALGDRPCIQMVQGPPGTGKSSVICAMVMSYFYKSDGKIHGNRGVILICATSNAAVDELVIRLLNIRQSLPKAERFRMVRVGRAEAMHPRARDVSSQQLAQRDTAARMQHQNVPPGLAEEVSHLEAKINMWKTQAQDAKDPVRVAYCQKNVSDIANRIALLRSNGGGGGKEIHAEQIAQVERRIIEGAHIVVTTLASAQNAKLRGLKGRIALCIVDEAGQAIEPETLIPLTLDVTRLTLIGDPQQLPGFICSQRAKKHGLGESLFSRLTSSGEHWPGGNPVVLLNQQYRMHPDIADYPNRAFYDGRITTVGTGPPRPDFNIPPYSIVGISSGDKGQVSGANEMEAWGVSRLVVALSALTRPLGLSLAVITPYNAHKDLIRKHLRTLLDPLSPQIEVNTVDSFQGQERDVMVVSLARSQGVGFLTDTGRMNVMLTRARHALLVALNPHAVLKNHQWRTLVEDAQRRNLYRILPNKMCQPLTASQTPTDDILKYITYSKSA